MPKSNHIINKKLISNSVDEIDERYRLNHATPSSLLYSWH